MAKVVATEPFACSSDVFVTSSSTWSDSSSSSSSSSSSCRFGGFSFFRDSVSNFTVSFTCCKMPHSHHKSDALEVGSRRAEVARVIHVFCIIALYPSSS